MARHLAVAPRRDFVPTVEESALFEAIIDDWRLELVGLNYKPKTIACMVYILRRLTRRLGFLWLCHPRAWVSYQGERKKAKKAPSTRHHDQVVARSFTTFIVKHPKWCSLLAERFGREPQIVVDRTNRLPPLQDEAAVLNVRGLEESEAHQFFGCLDDAVIKFREAGDNRRALVTNQYSLCFKLGTAFGLRRAEICDLRFSDFRSNRDVPEFGAFGKVVVRKGKAKPRGESRRRTVFLYHGLHWIVPELEQYKASVRWCWPKGPKEVLFLNQRWRQLQPHSLTVAFARWRDKAGLPKELRLHSLRHTFASYLARHGLPISVLMQQLGHECESSTMAYLDLGEPHQRAAVLQMQREFLGL